MYKLPEDININKIKNQNVTQISFGLNYVLLKLDRDHIQFSGPFVFQFGDYVFRRQEVFPVDSDFGLLKLIERKIEGISCNSERTSITLQFGENFLLQVGSNEMYECFEINLDKRRIIV